MQHCRHGHVHRRKAPADHKSTVHFESLSLKLHIQANDTTPLQHGDANT